MHFKKHYSQEGTHAFLSASNYHWINDTDDKLDRRFLIAQAASKGVRLHDLARRAINDGIRFSEDPDHMTEPYQQTLAHYVNDAIDFGMISEQVLYYSDNCYGTADTIGFRDLFLRISDYKSGVTRTSEKQLYVYAALFCLEYDQDPFEIDTELRIYQNGEVRVYPADPEMISFIMARIVAFDKRIEVLKERSV